MLYSRYMLYSAVQAYMLASCYLGSVQRIARRCTVYCYILASDCTAWGHIGHRGFESEGRFRKEHYYPRPCYTSCSLGGKRLRDRR